jgi:hypothetical protein
MKFVKFTGMKNFTIEKFVLILIVIVCILAFFTKDLTISFSKIFSDSDEISPEQIAQRFENLENIT